MEAQIIKSCTWCNDFFPFKKNGEKKQIFCCSYCKQEFEQELQQWSLNQYIQGKIPDKTRMLLLKYKIAIRKQ